MVFEVEDMVDVAEVIEAVVAVETAVVDKMKTKKEAITTMRVVEDATDQIGTILIVIIVKNMIIMQVSAIPRKRWSANFATKGETENNDVVLLGNKESDPKKENVWYLDIGASNHMCGHKHLFTELEEIENGHVSFGDASKVQVKGQGNILIQMSNDAQKFISSIYYVPG
jgi:hypothetical protein